MVRLRNLFIWCWVGGLITEILYFPLISVPALKDYFLPGLGVLSLCWVGGGCAAGLVHACLQKHIQHTFLSHHVNSLNYWSDGLLARAWIACFPRVVAKYFAEQRTGLLNQLPLLTEDTAYLLRSRERYSLFRTLKGQDAELISAVLQAIPVLDDARALPFIRHLAEGKGLAAMNEELRAEAQFILNRLQAVLNLSTGSQGLLRASSPPPMPEEHLLHPVQGNHETDPKELLRADIQK